MTQSNSGKLLRDLVERIERLEEEKKGIADDIREVYGEVKAAGFNPKVVREVVRLRKKDAQDRREHEEQLTAYKDALGMEN